MIPTFVDQVNRGKNRDWHAYASDCPEATLPEIGLARKAVNDELWPRANLQ